MTPSEELAEFRRRFGISQGVLAEAFGVRNRKTVSHWETGLRAPPLLVQRLIRIFLKLRRSEAEPIFALMQQEARGFLRITRK